MLYAISYKILPYYNKGTRLYCLICVCVRMHVCVLGIMIRIILTKAEDHIKQKIHIYQQAEYLDVFRHMYSIQTNCLRENYYPI